MKAFALRQQNSARSVVPPAAYLVRHSWWNMGLLALGALLLAGAALRSTLVHLRSAHSPAFIQQLAPRDSEEVAGAFMLRLAKLRPGSPYPDPAVWTARAEDALRVSPLGASALAMLGLYAHQNGEDDRALRLMTVAEKVTRREPLAQLWFIETSARRGNLSSVLAHYDRLLSTRPAAGDALFPKLASALSSPEIRRQLAALAGQGRPWMASFLSEATSLTPNPVNLARLFAEIDGGKEPDPSTRDAQVALVRKLTESGRFREAYNHASRIAGKQGPTLGRLDFREYPKLSELQPFAWTPGPDQGVFAQFAPGGRLRLEVAPGAYGIAMSKLILLAPGAYTLAFRADVPDGFAAADAIWQVECIGPRTVRLVGKARLGAGTRTGRLPFTVSSDCGAVRIAVIGRSPDSRDVTALDLVSVDIARSGNR